MTTGAGTASDARRMLARIEKGLRMVTVPLPHLAGLAAAVRVAIDDRVPTMGVFASGRLVANLQFTARLTDSDLVFVLAHELLHLALRTHDRAKGSGQLEFNYAHDYIINDMLRVALGVPTIPAGGLDMPGARDRSAEEIVVEMRRNGNFIAARTRVWDGEVASAGGVFGRSGSAADGAGDVLDVRQERELFPGDSADQDRRARQIQDLAARGLALGRAMGAMRGPGREAAASQQVVTALRGIYSTPWQVALQTWLEGVAPGERTFTRPSRRGADRHDVVMPGRKRYAWMLNVVLDTSGSMSEEIPRVLGAIADFCDAAAVDDVRVLQCDTAVTSDEVLPPAALAAYHISGYGGSDLTPAMHALADDSRVTAAVVITDGDITYPTEPVPYAVLWVLPPHAVPGFRPPYGRVITMQHGEIR